MCINRYVTEDCTVCHLEQVRRYVDTTYCSRSDGVHMCPPALREFHRGPTHNPVCYYCDRINAMDIFRGAYADQEVIPGLPQEESRRRIDDWHDSQRRHLGLREEFLDDGRELAQRSGGLLLEQPFNYNLAVAIADPPPEGMVIHQFHPRYSSGFYSPSRNGSQVADYEPHYPGYENHTAAVYHSPPRHDQAPPVAIPRDAVNRSAAAAAEAGASRSSRSSHRHRHREEVGEASSSSRSSGHHHRRHRAASPPPIQSPALPHFNTPRPGTVQVSLPPPPPPRLSTTTAGVDVSVDVPANFGYGYVSVSSSMAPDAGAPPVRSRGPGRPRSQSRNRASSRHRSSRH